MKMAYSGLNEFIARLEQAGELRRIHEFVDPSLEIAEVTHRISVSGGPALLFENTGTGLPLLINAFGSTRRMSLAIGRDNIDDAGKEMEQLFVKLSGSAGTLSEKLSRLPGLMKLAGILPLRKRSRGACQQIIERNPDLNILPVLKCWPYDGGRFITLPIVNTFHPVTRNTNAGMYRMQILDSKSTAMHWQLHKTGAVHFEAWKKSGNKMPVSVVLGGDPVYTYAATAPLPENVDEYILAGFLRRKRVGLVKCITNDIYVPEDSDIVIEGYVDPADEPVWEGPFGDHTGFYSLADWYPRFRVTCITRRKDAVYPATIVGIPPQEDSFITQATEKIFLNPIRMTLNAEINDLHMPDPGAAHNLVIVRIDKNYPGQGMKVINSLSGAGQLMFTKYLIVVSGTTDIRDYKELMKCILLNTDFSRDLLFYKGPLDVLDHASDTFAFGGKAGIDATVKTAGELKSGKPFSVKESSGALPSLTRLTEGRVIFAFNIKCTDFDAPVLIASVNRSLDNDIAGRLVNSLKEERINDYFRLVIIVDHSADVNNIFMVSWQVLANSDPVRDHHFLSHSSVLIDGTIKLYRPGGFSRKWPNVVCSDNDTIQIVDKKWESLGLGSFIPSPSTVFGKLKRDGEDEII
jgi:4-hydroxy-3-polyprenylbenzoate decarboxylase